MSTGHVYIQYPARPLVSFLKSGIAQVSLKKVLQNFDVVVDAVLQKPRDYHGETMLFISESVEGNRVRVVKLIQLFICSAADQRSEDAACGASTDDPRTEVLLLQHLDAA